MIVFKRWRFWALAASGGVALLCALGCGSRRAGGQEVPTAAPAIEQAAFLDTLEFRTFRYFWDLSDPHTGLTPDRHPTRSFASIAAVGFALTAYPIGIERGYVSREQGAERALSTLRFLWGLPQDSLSQESGGFRGFFYHFLEPNTGFRFKDVELSTQDTALLMAGVLFCGSYFDRPAALEDSIRACAERLYLRVDWEWAQVRPPLIAHGYTPESGFLPYDWGGFNEAMILLILALGSPTHGVGPGVWDAWTAGYHWDTFYGQDYVRFAPLFGHQYTQGWVDLRGIRDAFMRAHDSDYFENSRRAVLAQHAYAVDDPGGWIGYGGRFWGLTACDGPVDGTFDVGGRERTFHTYWARGAAFGDVRDDGTVAPTAAGGSLVFAPEIVLPTLVSMRDTYGSLLFSTYGFLDALNPTFRLPGKAVYGRVDPDRGWFDTDYLGIDEGPILIMAENYRSGLVWRIMRRNRFLIAGLRAAGFTGGWLDTVRVDR